MSFKANGQALLGIQFYLNNNQVSKAAKDFYNGKFKATDDKKTFSIIDSLNTKNNLTRPFYIFLVSKILDKSDGALSESLGASCKEFIETHPNFLLDFLHSNNKVADKHFLDNWSKQVASEFMIDCEGKINKCVKNSLQKASNQIKVDNKSRLIAFYNKVESYCH